MDGILIINKEKGWTSNDVVQKIKHITHEKVGHTGTLDPNATGVLPLLIGKGTKLSKYITNHDKEYIATLKLGEKRKTADIEGEIVEIKDVKKKIFNKKYIEKILRNCIGKQEQIPPIYSAIKVNGRKLYEYARNGIEVEIKPRNIEIYSLELIKFDKENEEIVFKVRCSKGTYIRTLCEKIAEELGTVGYMKELERTKVGEFYIENSKKISELSSDIENNIITVDEFLENKEL